MDANSSILFNPGLFFPNGAFSRLMRSMAQKTLRESCSHPGEPDERLLQCVWFDPDFRPLLLRTNTGEEVIVDHPGRWNFEAGPDFLQAAFRIGSDRRRLVGDVEIHTHANDWIRHGHGADPRFSNVKMHVTYYPAYLPADKLPPGTIQLSIKDALAAQPLFSFESIDRTAYPYAARAGSGRCQAVFAMWPPSQRASFLEAAGAERLALKAEHMAHAAAAKGTDQTLYEETLDALGYKHNRRAFRMLATRMPVHVLREESSLNPLRAYALLSGLAGLLPAQINARWDNETKTWAREIWNIWWTASARWAPRALARKDWRLAGLRPPNRPERRIMAAACYFAQRKSFTEQMEQLDPELPNFMESVMSLLENDPAPESYWNRRWSLGGPKTAAPVALVGKRRASAMLSNVLLPFLAANGKSSALSQELLRRLPAEEDNSLIRQAAHDLFGPDHNPEFYRSGLRQQGLLHIFHAYCLGDRSACRHCTLPDTLATVTQSLDLKT